MFAFFGGAVFGGDFGVDFDELAGVKDRFSMRLSTSSSVAARNVKERMEPWERSTRVD